jgi:hypothetical protein
MSTDQHLLPSEGSVSYMRSQMPLPTSSEFEHTRDVHALIDAITAAVIGAQAGLNWLRTQPSDLGEVRKSLNQVVSDGKRAGEIVARLQALVNKRHEG